MTQRAGFPHSDIRGSTFARNSPRLFAACHVLHRRSVPRHPPGALLMLDPPPRTGTNPVTRQQRPTQRFVYPVKTSCSDARADHTTRNAPARSAARRMSPLHPMTYLSTMSKTPPTRTPFGSATYAILPRRPKPTLAKPDAGRVPPRPDPQTPNRRHRSA